MIRTNATIEDAVRKMGLRNIKTVHLHLLLVSGEKKVCAVPSPSGQFSLEDLPLVRQHIGEDQRPMKNIAEKTATSFPGVKVVKDSELVMISRRPSASPTIPSTDLTILFICRIASQPQLPAVFEWMNKHSINKDGFCGDRVSADAARLVSLAFDLFMADAHGWRRVWEVVQRTFGLVKDIDAFVHLWRRGGLRRR